MKISAIRSIPVGAVVLFNHKGAKKTVDRKGILVGRRTSFANAIVHVPRLGAYSVDDRDMKEVLHLPRI